MKTLLVLRHAKAERDSATGEDFDRPLAQRGWRDAEAVGGEMRRRALVPDRVLASPAKRAAETVEALARGYGPLEPGYDRRIYAATERELLAIVKEAGDAPQRLMLVGHNPGLQELILRLAGEEASDECDRIVDGFPTAALAVLELPAARWSDVQERTGRIVALIVPKALR